MHLQPKTKPVTRKSDSDITKITLTTYFTILLNSTTEKETNQCDKDFQIGMSQQEKRSH